MVYSVPMIFAVAIAIAVGNLLSLSVYDSLLAMGDWPYLPILRSDASFRLTAGDVMVPLSLAVSHPRDDGDDGGGNPWSTGGSATQAEDAFTEDTVFPVIPRCTKYKDIKKILESEFTPFNQLIVIVDAMENMLLLGSVSRRHLNRALARFRNEALREALESVEFRPSSKRQPARTSSTSDSSVAPPAGGDDAAAAAAAAEISTNHTAAGSSNTAESSATSRQRSLRAHEILTNRRRVVNFDDNALEKDRVQQERDAARQKARTEEKQKEAAEQKKSHERVLRTLGLDDDETEANEAEKPDEIRRLVPTVRNWDNFMKTVLKDFPEDQKRVQRAMKHVYTKEIDLYEFRNMPVNPAPFQVVKHSPLSELIYSMSLLHTQYAFVTEFGQLVGVCTKPRIVRKVKESAKRSANATPAPAAINTLGGIHEDTINMSQAPMPPHPEDRTLGHTSVLPPIAEASHSSHGHFPRASRPATRASTPDLEAQGPDASTQPARPSAAPARAGSGDGRGAAASGERRPGLEARGGGARSSFKGSSTSLDDEGMEGAFNLLRVTPGQRTVDELDIDGASSRATLRRPKRTISSLERGRASRKPTAQQISNLFAEMKKGGKGTGAGGMDGPVRGDHTGNEDIKPLQRAESPEQRRGIPSAMVQLAGVPSAVTNAGRLVQEEAERGARERRESQDLGEQAAEGEKPGVATRAVMGEGSHGPPPSHASPRRPRRAASTPSKAAAQSGGAGLHSRRLTGRFSVRTASPARASVSRASAAALPSGPEKPVGDKASALDSAQNDGGCFTPTKLLDASAATNSREYISIPMDSSGPPSKKEPSSSRPAQAIQYSTI